MVRVLRNLKRCLFILLLLFVFLLLLFHFKFHDIINDLAQVQVKNTTSDIINKAIMQQISAGEIRYDRMVYFEKDLSGRITALKTNMSEINRLKTDVLARINDQILTLDTAYVSIPIGSLIFPAFFSGKGPAIPVRIISIRNSDAFFSSHFSEAGINQTLHQINMKVYMDIAVLVLGRTEMLSMDSEMVVAETVIVGEVPNTLFQPGGYNGTQTENTGTGRNP